MHLLSYPRSCAISCIVCLTPIKCYAFPYVLACAVMHSSPLLQSCTLSCPLQCTVMHCHTLSCYHYALSCTLSHNLSYTLMQSYELLVTTEHLQWHQHCKFKDCTVNGYLLSHVLLKTRNSSLTDTTALAFGHSGSIGDVVLPE